jgi:hypothetical protein
MATVNSPTGVATSPPPPTPPGAVPVYEVPPPGSESVKRISHIVVYGHSNLFYWWPVWVMCFVLAGWTYLDGDRMAVVPTGTEPVAKAQVSGYAEPRDVLVAPPGRSFDGEPADGQLGMTVSHSNGLGVIFAFTLFIVALVSTLTLRGLVSLVVIIGMIVVVLTLALMDWWDDVFAFLGGLDIRMNAAGYLFIGIPLFVAWCLVTFVYDRAHYMIFDEGQIRYVREVGESEIVMASEGAMVEKKRDDVFRHWLLGFGSGDIQVRTGGAHGQYIELANVLNIGRKLVVINDMLQHKAVTAAA